MSPRTSLVLGLVLASATVSCTVLEDMGGYTGGTAADSGIAATDSTVPGTDTSVVEDDGVVDTNVPDTGSPKDSTVPDTGTPPDTAVTDTGTDTGVAPDTAVTDTGGTTVDAADCTGFPNVFGISEVMVRAVNGSMFSSDRREWIEFTNYGSTSLDISGVTAKVIGGGTPPVEKATVTFPPGTTLAAGEAVVVAIDKPTFMSDLSSSWGTIKVFDFGKTSGDVLTNSASFDVKLYAQAGCTTAFESATVPGRGSAWTVGVAYGYPIPNTTCTVAGRLTTAGGLSAPWKDASKDSASTYGTLTLPSDAGVQSMYGTPGKPNTGIACP